MSTLFVTNHEVAFRFKNISLTEVKRIIKECDEENILSNEFERLEKITIKEFALYDTDFSKTFENIEEFKQYLDDYKQYLILFCQ